MISSLAHKGRRWLVTGAAGFVGSNLSAFLMERGEVVVGLDNFFTGKRDNIDRLERRFGKRFLFHEGDILDRPRLKQAMDGCQAVAHLAAQVSVIRSIDDPAETHDINTTGFMEVIHAGAAAGVADLIYASSCAVYGDNDAVPLHETTEARPTSPYAASKLANEAYAAGFRVLAPDLKMVGLRFFNIFGAWQDAASGYAAVIPKWTDLLLDGKQPVLFGDGSATRDFCHVHNVCDAIWSAACASHAASGRVFNVATGVATRLDELCGLIVQRLKEAGIVPKFTVPEHYPWRAGEIVYSYADISAAEAGLGFRAAIGLEDGLRRMLKEEYGLSISDTVTTGSRSLAG